MSQADIEDVIRAFAEQQAAHKEAGFQVVEIHAAHGYLLHQFLSPISNQRTGQLRRQLRPPHAALLLAVSWRRCAVWPEPPVGCSCASAR